MSKPVDPQSIFEAWNVIPVWRAFDILKIDNQAIINDLSLKITRQAMSLWASGKRNTPSGLALVLNEYAKFRVKLHRKQLALGFSGLQALMKKPITEQWFNNTRDTLMRVEALIEEQDKLIAEYPESEVAKAKSIMAEISWGKLVTDEIASFEEKLATRLKQAQSAKKVATTKNQQKRERQRLLRR